MRTGFGRKLMSIILALSIATSLGACNDRQAAADPPADDSAVSGDSAATDSVPTDNAAADTQATDHPTAAADAPAAEPVNTDAPADKNGEIYILFTSDVHCGINDGFGYAGLMSIRDNLERRGYTTLLVDDGDAIQGEPLGTLSKGSAIIDLMNDLHYDVAIPGNHEFDYGMEQFLKLVDQADFPYISCNLTKDRKPVFAPYLIKEAAGIKIGFVGVTTPTSIVSSNPSSFQDENGQFIYGFMQDEDGSSVYNAVQKAVDDARAEGAELIYVLGHMGMDDADRPWTYADIIANTTGIDVFLDGHSHDTEQITMKNKAGEEVTRSAAGTQLNALGYSHINADKEIVETGIWSWPNKESAVGLFALDNEISHKVEAALENLNIELDRVIAASSVELTINDPSEKDDSGNPIRMIRRAETNLGDLCADAYRDQSGAQIAIVNGGGIRNVIGKGDITYGDIIRVHPYGNSLCVVEANGQQILDALEWGAYCIPDEHGGFLQVSGLSYEIDASVDSSCYTDENGMFAGIRGSRRVSNVMVGDQPLDPKKLYTVVSSDYLLLDHGDGFTMFDKAKLVQDRFTLDNQVLIDYIVNTLGGVIGGEYQDPCGQGRIVIKD